MQVIQNNLTAPQKELLNVEENIILMCYFLATEILWNSTVTILFNLHSIDCVICLLVVLKFQKSVFSLCWLLSYGMQEKCFHSNSNSVLFNNTLSLNKIGNKRWFISLSGAEYFYEPPPDYDVEPKYRRWSVAANPTHNLNLSQSIHTHPTKTQNISIIESCDIKIPKTQLQKQHLNRARSQSPSWNQRQTVGTKAEKQTRFKVATSRSYYELGGVRQKPEVPSDGKFERDQVCNCSSFPVV